MAVENSTQTSNTLPRFYGLSTDEKPSGTLVGGATFLEKDTGFKFTYTGSEWVREQGIVEQAATIVTKEETRDLEFLLEAQLVQLKILNAHFALLNDEVLDESDIPVEVR